MSSRFRHLAAIFALIALTVGTVQGLWAATCHMEMSAETTAPPPPAQLGSGIHGVSALADGAGSSRDDAGPEAPHCPFAPMGMAGVCGPVTAVPAESSAATNPASAETRLPCLAIEARDLLLAHAFFRPPIG